MREYRIEYAKGVVKDLKKLPRDVVLGALEVVERDLALDPHRGRPLTGPYRGLWKYRIGDCRIIYSIVEERVTVFVLRIRHRKDVYLGIV